jgi:hypothetical protein
MKLQLNGFATIAGSKKLAPEVKEQILEAGEGKVKSLQVRLTDAEGNVVVLKGALQLSSQGSLMARYALKIESFDLVEIDDPKVDRPTASKEEKEEARVNQLAAELLG